MPQYLSFDFPQWTLNVPTFVPYWDPSKVAFNARAGTTYYIAVDGYSELGGPAAEGEDDGFNLYLHPNVILVEPSPPHRQAKEAVEKGRRMGRERLKIGMAGSGRFWHTAGCEVHPYPAFEIGINGSGGPTCLTRPLLRQA
jgi:hypothetical protein